MHGEAVGRRKLEDALEERFRQGAELKAEILFEGFAIELTFVGRG